MRPVFQKFLKFRKVRRNFKDCTDRAGRFWKNRKKQDTASGAVNAVIWPRCHLQLNYSIGGNFNIHPPTFSMDGCFPFYYAPGSFLSQNFRHFDPTLAGPILDQVEPSGILLNPSDSPACVVSVSDSLTTGDPSSSCEMIILHNNSHGGIIRVCMRIFTTALRNQTMCHLTLLPQRITCYLFAFFDEKNPF